VSSEPSARSFLAILASYRTGSTTHRLNAVSASAAGGASQFAG